MVGTLYFALAITLATWITPGSDSRTHREVWVMGTRLEIEVQAADPAQGAESTEGTIREIEGMDRLLSTWDPASEMARVNGAEPASPVAIPSSLAHLLVEARAWSRRTHGAFEPAVGALVDAWDLRGEGRIPSPEELAAALDASGPEVFLVHGVERTVLRTGAVGWLDTGAFGKGAALREAARLLRGHRIERALVDLGGQLWVMGDSSRPWPVAVADPGNRSRAAVPLALSNVSVATSGGSERWVEIGGSRYGHILDPRTGLPVPDWGSVTVVSPDPLEADILSTALYVMGPRVGLAWVEEELPHLAVLFLEFDQDSPGGLLTTWTAPMERWFAQPPPPSCTCSSPIRIHRSFPYHGLTNATPVRRTVRPRGASRPLSDIPSLRPNPRLGPGRRTGEAGGRLGPGTRAHPAWRGGRDRRHLRWGPRSRRLQGLQGPAGCVPGGVRRGPL